MEGGLPFDVRQPRYSAETEVAMREVRGRMSDKVEADSYDFSAALFRPVCSHRGAAEEIAQGRSYPMNTREAIRDEFMRMYVHERLNQLLKFAQRPTSAPPDWWGAFDWAIEFNFQPAFIRWQESGLPHPTSCLRERWPASGKARRASLFAGTRQPTRLTSR